MVLQRPSEAWRPLFLKISFPEERVHLLGKFVVRGLHKNRPVREDYHGNDYPSSVCFSHEVPRLVVLVDVDLGVRRSVLVEESSRPSGVWAPGCAVYYDILGEFLHLQTILSLKFRNLCRRVGINFMLSTI